ncbi:arylalkylamine N-acetyltransferase 1-like isoform X2 [Hetaerina americana]
MAEPSYEIVPVQPEDHDKVMAFLRRTFFVDEPLNIAIGLLEGQPTCPEDGRPSCRALEAHCREALSHNLSLMAVDTEKGNVVGVTLNAESAPEGSAELSTEAMLCPDPKFRRILNLMVHIEKECKVFQRFGVERLLEMRILSVDGEWRGKGIATALIRQTLEQTKELGYPLFRVDCTSAFSAKAMERVGLKRIYTLKYEDYLEEEEGDAYENGIIDTGAKDMKKRKPVFKPAPPHYGVTAFVKEIKAN